MQSTSCAPVFIHYRYMTGMYHFFDCFPEWYGIPKSGLVCLFWLFLLSPDFIITHQTPQSPLLIAQNDSLRGSVASIIVVRRRLTPDHGPIWLRAETVVITQQQASSSAISVEIHHQTWIRITSFTHIEDTTEYTNKNGCLPGALNPP